MVPQGQGCLDYSKYISSLKSYVDIPYFVLEYYKSKEDLIKARDIVITELGGLGKSL